jgi:hypothetical protein
MEDLDWTCCRTTDIFYKVHWVREEAKSLVHVAVHRTSATALPWTRRQRSPHRIFQFNQLPRYARCFPNDLRWRPRRFVTRIALRITFASLIRLVKQFDTNHDVAAIMVATLKWAQAAEREHDVKLADALLDVSIDEVLEQSGKSLTAARPPP